MKYGDWIISTNFHTRYKRREMGIYDGYVFLTELYWFFLEGE